MKTSITFIVVLLSFLNTSAQTSNNEYSLLFYNTENLFDIRNDSLTNDDEFTPDGARHWTYNRLEKKLLNTSKVILTAAGWNPPTLVALCEVENRYVLNELCDSTPLKTIPYKIIHKESPDFRGIDVALLYNSEIFYPLIYEYYPLLDENGIERRSREILYVSGIMDDIDTIHVFVNHWPSRYSGLMETRELRNDAARLLRKKVDLLIEQNSSAKIIIVGDFNDQSNDQSLYQFLQALKVSNTAKTDKLYNLSSSWNGREMGTLKYQSQWFIFDQIIVSGALLNAESGLYTAPDLALICELPFLFEKDKTYGGIKLNRTYNGFKYNGGFSDHLPVILKLKTH